MSLPNKPSPQIPMLSYLLHNTQLTSRAIDHNTSRTPKIAAKTKAFPKTIPTHIAAPVKNTSLARTRETPALKYLACAQQPREKRDTGMGCRYCF